MVCCDKHLASDDKYNAVGWKVSQMSCLLAIVQSSFITVSYADYWNR